MGQKLGGKTDGGPSSKLPFRTGPIEQKVYIYYCFSKPDLNTELCHLVKSAVWVYILK